MHIGNLRTALYAYCFARHNGGKFLLRIEDTDRKRNVPRSIQVIYDSLRLAGLDYDEGPVKGGPVGPYVQSERKEQGIYQRHADMLVERGAAYRCFCTKEDLEAQKQAKIRLNPCRFLTPDEISARMQDNLPYVIRQRIPEGGATTFHDLVFGAITIKNSQLDDQVLLKSDGYPTYNFANVVDDHLMGITHVLRGVEYLSSTPKYDLLYQSFDWPIPQYVHLPHIVKESGKKLSKRAGDASFQDLIARGLLPEAIVNYIALLGWSPGNDQEFFTLESLVEAFDITHINKSSAAFSMDKLEWLNGEHIRRLPVERFHRAAEPFYPEELKQTGITSLISPVIQSRVTRLTDISEMTRFFVQPAPYEVDLFEHAKSKSTCQSSLRVLRETAPLLADINHWDEPQVREVLLGYAVQTGQKTGTVMWPIRAALSGLPTTPGGATELAAILGKVETLKRIAAAAAFLEQAGAANPG
jgi:glutamyl-tRNA synthetase